MDVLVELSCLRGFFGSLFDAYGLVTLRFNGLAYGLPFIKSYNFRCVDVLPSAFEEKRPTVPFLVPIYDLEGGARVFNRDNIPTFISKGLALVY